MDFLIFVATFVMPFITQMKQCNGQSILDWFYRENANTYSRANKISLYTEEMKKNATAGTPPDNVTTIIETYRTMIISSSIVSVATALVCLVITCRMFAFQRWGINRRLLLLSDKLNKLEERLGTRQLPDALLKKVCELIGADYKKVIEDRQRFAQDAANDERKLIAEVVADDHEAQYDTMVGVVDVFAKQGECNTRQGKSKEGAGYEDYNSKVVTKGDSQKGEDAAAGKMDEKEAKELKTAIPKEPAEDTNVIRPPKEAAMANENDPNYETLHGIYNAKVFPEKTKGTAPKEFKEDTNVIRPPKFTVMVDEKDPNYETFKLISKTNVFDDKTKGVATKKPDTQKGLPEKTGVEVTQPTVAPKNKKLEKTGGGEKNDEKPREGAKDAKDPAENKGPDRLPGKEVGKNEQAQKDAEKKDGKLLVENTAPEESDLVGKTHR